MRGAAVIFRECILDGQLFGSDQRKMVSRIFFDLEVEGRVYSKLSAEIEQEVGREEIQLRVMIAPDWGKGLDPEVFRRTIEDYYREQMASKDAGRERQKNFFSTRKKTVWLPSFHP